MALDKKSKKRHEVLRKKLEKLQAQLVGAKQQEDEPGEVAGIEKEIEETRAEMARLKA